MQYDLLLWVRFNFHRGRNPPIRIPVLQLPNSFSWAIYVQSFLRGVPPYLCGVFVDWRYYILPTLRDLLWISPNNKKVLQPPQSPPSLTSFFPSCPLSLPPRPHSPYHICQVQNGIELPWHLEGRCEYKVHPWAGGRALWDSEGMLYCILQVISCISRRCSPPRTTLWGIRGGSKEEVMRGSYERWHFISVWTYDEGKGGGQGGEAKLGCLS